MIKNNRFLFLLFIAILMISLWSCQKVVKSTFNTARATINSSVSPITTNWSTIEIDDNTTLFATIKITPVNVGALVPLNYEILVDTQATFRNAKTLIPSFRATLVADSTINMTVSYMNEFLIKQYNVTQGRIFNTIYIRQKVVVRNADNSVALASDIIKTIATINKVGPVF